MQHSNLQPQHQLRAPSVILITHSQTNDIHCTPILFVNVFSTIVCMPNRDNALVERSIGFHGIPMQKVWEGEHGDQDLARANVALDFSVYQARQKGFVFGDRTKRLQLHQFIARKADVLFDRKTTATDVDIGSGGGIDDGAVSQLEGDTSFLDFYIPHHNLSR